MKQTAIEWLIENSHIIPKNELYKRELINQAKEMEKQQIVDANIAGMEFIAVDPNHYNNDAQQYYNETFNK